MSRGLAGKVGVVAGGATGIGAATATRLAAEGALVVIGDVSGDGAEATAESIRGSGGTAAAVTFDLADPDSVRALTDSAVAEFGGVDLLFNVGSDMSLLRDDTDVVDIDFAVWDRTMTVTLRGYLAAMKYAIPAMPVPWRRCHRQHVLGGRLHRRAHAAGVCGGEGRHRRAHPARRIPVGARRNPLQCSRSRLHRHRHDALGAAVADLEAAALRKTPSTRVGHPTTSPRWSPS